jgi:tetratricopeptide (TPR) repeat protein
MAERRGDSVALLKATEALSQAAAHPRSSSAALSDLGRALTLGGDLAGAERALRQAVTRLPVAPDAFLRLAAVAERQGRLPEARDALLQHVALVGDRDPLAPLASRIADLSARIGEPLLAARWLDRAIDEGGPTPTLLARLADAALRGGDVARAREAVETGLQLAPQHDELQAIKRRLDADHPRP